MTKKRTNFAFSEPEENTGYLLWQVSMGWQLRMNQQLKTVGLTITQFSLLASLHWLTRQGELITQQQVANYAHTDKMMTSKVLQTLERKKLIIRASHSEDNRARQLMLTDEGYALLSQANQIVEQVDVSFFGPVRADKTIFDRLMQQLMHATG